MTTPNKNTESDWYGFQEEICEHFKNLGANAKTNVTVEGVRGSSNIDVVVESKYLGTDFKWFVEAKYWNSNVTKEIVHAFFTVLQNTGADRGFIISKTGFQSGAIEATKHTNISLYTFEEFKAKTSHLVQSNILKSFLNRAILTSTRYWGHTKEIRIKYELRYEMFDYREILSCAVILIIVTDLIIDEEITYPLDVSRYIGKQKEPINSFHELMHWLNSSLNELDRRILDAEIIMRLNSEFNPVYEYFTPDIIRICTKERIDKFLDYSFLPEKEREMVIEQQRLAENYRKSRKGN
ncbi:TPA: restriction endonuclease [Klebsiella variicola]|uniref:restriction endonuclease n=1 Tax=Klebsiella pneumoniae complex TaxID=3390273 RepID=UPI000668161C|nr:restriction endonuclease [Klebsiella variicola]HEO9243325.1 restriction endonuclease [Enterobacter ludwigii]